MKEIEKWIEKAEKDLNDAEFNLVNGRFEIAAFLSHQAAEKALKALYILKFKRLWKIHDLGKLSLAIKASKKIKAIVNTSLLNKFLTFFIFSSLKHANLHPYNG